MLYRFISLFSTLDERNKFCLLDSGTSKVQPDQGNFLVIGGHRTLHPNLTHHLHSKNKTAPLPTTATITGSSATLTEKNVELKSTTGEVKKQKFVTTNRNTNKQFTRSWKTTRKPPVTTNTGSFSIMTKRPPTNTTGYYSATSKGLPISYKYSINQKTSTFKTSAKPSTTGISLTSIAGQPTTTNHITTSANQFLSIHSPTDEITTHSSLFPTTLWYLVSSRSSTLKESITQTITSINTETETLTHSTAYDVTTTSTITSAQPSTAEQTPSSIVHQSTVSTTAG